jgi:hypothetical protein
LLSIARQASAQRRQACAQAWQWSIWCLPHSSAQAVQAAQLRCKFAAARHIGGCHPADRRAIHVERNAARHHLDVVFLQAGGRAVVAGRRAGVTGVDAGLVFGVLECCHRFLHLGVQLLA